MQTLETPRLFIRNFRADDCDALHKMIVQYQASEYAAYDQQWPTSRDEIKGIAEWFASSDNFLAVGLKDSDLFIGFVALNPEEGQTDRVFNIGYVFDSDYHGQGYATEACRAVLEHAFQSLHAQQVITGTAAANLPSCRLLERLGFQKTAESMGTFRNAPDGTPIEFLGYTYALSNDQWTK